MNEVCANCKKALKKYHEIIKQADSILDAASDFDNFFQNCSKKCKKILKTNDRQPQKEKNND